MERLVADLHTLDSKVTILGQRLQTIEKNEEVLGRTLVTLNNRLKKVESGGVAGSNAGGASADTAELDKKYASRQELKEIRYVIDSINPLEYATISQVRELLKEKLGDVKKTVAEMKKDSKDDSTGLFEKM